MPMTDPERKFIDHHALEAAYPQLRADAARRQIEQRQLDEVAFIRFAAILGEEWQAWEFPLRHARLSLGPQVARSSGRLSLG